jgi:predicted DNA-binding transcriptional regulator YafY
VAERRVLAVEYHGAQRTELTIRKVEPLGLAYYNNNWHLIAYCRLRQDVRDFRTDRICALQVQNELFSGHAGFSLKRYLEAASRAGKFEAVKVLFQPEVMERVRREWSSRLAEERIEKPGVVGTLLAYSMEGVAEWVLSFGGKAEVLAPEHLRHLVAAEAVKVVSKYGTFFENTSTRLTARQNNPKLSPVGATH